SRLPPAPAQRLTGQAGGLEGIPSVLEERDPLDPPVTEGPEPRESRLQFDSVATAEVGLDRGDEPIADLDELVRLVAKRLPDPSEALDELGNVVPLIDALFRADRAGEVEGEIARGVLQRGGKVPAIERSDDTPSHDGLLLRHRSLSI